MNATHAVVGPKEGFFLHAFGETVDDFIELIYMPELYITKRKENSENIERWKRLFRSLTTNEKNSFINLIKDNKFPVINLEEGKIKTLYECYYK